jgi:hypothetical protein
MLTPKQAVALQFLSQYDELEARTASVMHRVELVYLQGKVLDMRRLLADFSKYATENGQAMLAIARDVQRVLALAPKPRKANQ